MTTEKEMALKNVLTRELNRIQNEIKVMSDEDKKNAEIEIDSIMHHLYGKNYKKIIIK